MTTALSIFIIITPKLLGHVNLLTKIDVWLFGFIINKLLNIVRYILKMTISNQKTLFLCVYKN